jgi:exopolysaccharide production protein ExoY
VFEELCQTEANQRGDLMAAPVHLTARSSIARDATVSFEKPALALSAKRLGDISIAFLALVLLGPVMAVICIVIRRSDPGPILFRQTRIGKAGREFKCYKFRTMVLDAERILNEHLEQDESARREWGTSQKLTVDPRITPLGSFLRKTSLDELPQFFNVLAGDMSLVGPRPIVRDEIPKYGDKIRYYLAVRPGITGLWQVSGRSDCSYPERVALDTRYVSEWSLKADIIILLKTIPAVLLQAGSR